MREKMLKKLAELKQEFGKAQSILDEVEVKRRETRDSLLRIYGAIQVLEETLLEQAADQKEKEIYNV